MTPRPVLDAEDNLWRVGHADGRAAALRGDPARPVPDRSDHYLLGWAVGWRYSQPEGSTLEDPYDAILGEPLPDWADLDSSVD